MPKRKEQIQDDHIDAVSDWYGCSEQEAVLIIIEQSEKELQQAYDKLEDSKES